MTPREAIMMMAPPLPGGTPDMYTPDALNAFWDDILDKCPCDENTQNEISLISEDVFHGCDIHGNIVECPNEYPNAKRWISAVSAYVYC